MSPAKAKTNQLVASAELQTHELQELADKIAELKSAAAGIDLKFKLQIEMGGESRPPEEAIEQINELLQEISENLKLQ
ncbi:MAG TPA: hypothetical protein DCE56_02175 [Cyanobacteria bacterium UBA8553]|nr:hypothetical protein [Cyanobacteria bacterium UBA8553]